MVFSSSTQKVAGAPNLDTFVDDQDFGGSGDYSDYRPYDHRGGAGGHHPFYHTPATPAPSSTSDDASSRSRDPSSYDSNRGGGGLLDATDVATYDDEDYGSEDYGSGDYDASYDGDTYDDEYDWPVHGGHVEEHQTSTTTPPPPPSTTTQPPPPPPPVVEVTTTSTTTTPPPTTTSPPSSIIEENGIYSTDDERSKADGGEDDYNYDDEEYDDEYYDEEYSDIYDDEDYGGEGSGAGVIPEGHSEDTHNIGEDMHHHPHEDHDMGGARGGEDHFTFDRAPDEEVEEAHIPHYHAPEHEEPAPPRTDNEIYIQNNLTTGHTDHRLPEAEEEEEEEHDDDSDPYGRHRPVDTADEDLAPGAGDDHYGQTGSTTMDGSVQIVTHKEDDRQVSIFAQPGILAAFIGGAVVGLLCAILLVMFVVYRMRKKDEGSYPLDEPKRLPLTSSYATTDKEIYA